MEPPRFGPDDTHFHIKLEVRRLEDDLETSESGALNQEVLMTVVGSILYGLDMPNRAYSTRPAAEIVAGPRAMYVCGKINLRSERGLSASASEDEPTMFNVLRDLLSHVTTDKSARHALANPIGSPTTAGVERWGDTVLMTASAKLTYIDDGGPYLPGAIFLSARIGLLPGDCPRGRLGRNFTVAVTVRHDRVEQGLVDVMGTIDCRLPSLREALAEGITPIWLTDSRGNRVKLRQSPFAGIPGDDEGGQEASNDPAPPAATATPIATPPAYSTSGDGDGDGNDGHEPDAAGVPVPPAAVTTTPAGTPPADSTGGDGDDGDEPEAVATTTPAANTPADNTGGDGDGNGDDGDEPDGAASATPGSTPPADSTGGNGDGNGYENSNAAGNPALPVATATPVASPPANSIGGDGDGDGDGDSGEEDNAADTPALPVAATAPVASPPSASAGGDGEGTETAAAASVPAQTNTGGYDLYNGPYSSTDFKYRSDHDGVWKSVLMCVELDMSKAS